MVAKELQLGDWVKCLDSTHENKVFAQVDAIEEGQTCILVQKDVSNWFLDIEQLEPIPMTAEILRKNELREDRSNVTFRLHEYNGNAFDYMCILFHGQSVYTTKVCIEHGGENGEIRRVEMGGCVFVHQLQQALRLCGIEKEITL